MTRRPGACSASCNSWSPEQVGDLQAFIKEYNLQCPMAVQRLVASGMPATVEHGKPSGASQNIARLAAETVQYFITAMDAVKMKMAAADEVSCLTKGCSFKDSFSGTMSTSPEVPCGAAAVPSSQRPSTVHEQRAALASSCWTAYMSACYTQSLLAGWLTGLLGCRYRPCPVTLQQS